MIGNYTNERGEKILQTLFTSNDFDSHIADFEEFYKCTSDGDFNTITIENNDNMDEKIQTLLANDSIQTYKGCIEGLSIFLIILALEMPSERLKPIIILQFLL